MDLLGNMLSHRAAINSENECYCEYCGMKFSYCKHPFVNDITCYYPTPELIHGKAVCMMCKTDATHLYQQPCPGKAARPTAPSAPKAIQKRAECRCPIRDLLSTGHNPGCEGVSK